MAFSVQQFEGIQFLAEDFFFVTCVGLLVWDFQFATSKHSHGCFSSHFSVLVFIAVLFVFMLSVPLMAAVICLSLLFLM